MEVLKSTEVLDREILEDARKKADRLLRAADQAVAASKEGWARKADRDIAELESRYAARTASERAEKMARVPLDKKRARAERAEGLLRSAMDAFLRSLPRAVLLGFVEADARGRLAAAGRDGMEKGRAIARGMSEIEARALLAALDLGDWDLAAPEGEGALPALVLEAPDVRVRADVAEKAAELLADNRGELAEALLGPEACDD